MNLERLYEIAPIWGQEIMVTCHNLAAYRKRYGSNYAAKKAYFSRAAKLPEQELLDIQSNRLRNFLENAKQNSPHYKDALKDFRMGDITLETLSELPVLEKEFLRSNTDKIFTCEKNKCYIAKTGGTTGMSLQVRFLWEDIEERLAMLDVFRVNFGLKRNSRVAWFSGKTLICSNQNPNTKYSRKDFLHNIHYYSTFHVNEKTITRIVSELNKFKPEFLVGFPSTICDIARIASSKSLTLDFAVSSIFPTAETVTIEHRELARSFYKAEMRNQYASSEGAPFITECEYGNLHYELLSGVIEVVDVDGKPAKSGKMLVTSFTTNGTPLIRYDIGDCIDISESIDCQCGRKTPLICSIDGRVDDFLYSEKTGRINLGNISNAVKKAKGVVKFQVHQNSTNEIVVFVVRDGEYNDFSEAHFHHELVSRFGEEMNIVFNYVNDIKAEKSGKYRLIKNNLKIDEINR